MLQNSLCREAVAEWTEEASGSNQIENSAHWIKGVHKAVLDTVIKAFF